MRTARQMGSKYKGGRAMGSAMSLAEVVARLAVAGGQGIFDAVVRSFCAAALTVLPILAECDGAHLAFVLRVARVAPVCPWSKRTVQRVARFGESHSPMARYIQRHRIQHQNQHHLAHCVVLVITSAAVRE